MQLFGRSKKTDESAAAPSPVTIERPRSAKKDHATPTRREAEAARRARMNPQLDPKSAKRKARDDRNADRRREMAAVDATPGKQLMRDFIDTRFNIGEWSMPVILVLLAVSLTATGLSPTSMLVQVATWATWALFAGIFADMTLMWQRYKRIHGERLPNEPLKGLLYYGFNRAMQPRRMRVPPARLKRGDSF